MTIENLSTFILSKLPELGQKLYQQIFLVGMSMGLAILIGVPCGILITRYVRFRTPILGFANILQTIPSLALLTFFLPFFGIGAKPAIMALTLYALLPVIRSTYTGIQGVPPASTEAARGLGFTNFQRLWMVELPLSLPSIVSGIRIATAISVGIATLAAFIGAGGLGDFINQGLTLNNMRLVMLGAIPAALLALLLDFAIGKIEHSLSKEQPHRRNKKRTVTITIIVISMIIAFFSFIAFQSMQNHRNTITVGSKNFTEQIILGEIMSQLIEAKTNIKVIRKFNLGSTQIIQQAMQKKEIDLYPEYTGTAFLVILHRKPISSPEIVYKAVKDYYKKHFNIVWLKPFGFNNTQALAVRDDFSKEFNIQTISDLLPLENQLILGSPSEFIGRPDGLVGLQRVYKIHFSKIKEMDPGLMYKAIRDNQVNVISAFTTDGRIPAYHLHVLIDDRKLFPPYYAVPLIRNETLKKYPELRKILDLLANKIDNQTMQQLNLNVDLKNKLPFDVAHDFLKKQALLTRIKDSRMKLTSTAFNEHEKIPSKYTCDGENINPPLTIQDVPDSAKSLALIMDDPDVPKKIRSDGMYDHWLVFNISPNVKEINEGEEPEGTHGMGTSGSLNYFGPCPPQDGQHRYFFKVYALDKELKLPEKATKQQVLSMMHGHVIDAAELMGFYQRK